MKTHHVCYEGTLACSGCNPCGHCLEVVRAEVLARAMRYTTEAIVQSRGPRGIVGVEELDAKNFWALFYGFYAKAWGDLHDAMMRDPKVVERAYDLRAIPGFASTGRYVPPLASAPVIVPLSSLASHVTTSPTMSESPIGDTSAPWTASFTLHDAAHETASSAPTEAPPHTEEEDGDVPMDAAMDPPIVTAPADIRTPIRVDDIAASASILKDVPLPAPSSANGISVHE